MKTQKNTQSAAPAFVEPVADTGSKANPNAPAGTKAKTLADMATISMNAGNSRKTQFLGTVRQQLAELADYNIDSAEAEAKFAEQAGTVAYELYQGRRDGILTADEVSVLLGETFGFKAKKDGSPSKTPDGKGTVIRQRVVRAVSMAEVLDGKNDGGAFYASLPDEALDEVQSVRNRLDNGQIGIWTAYKELGDIRSAYVSRPKLAFDASRVSALADELADAQATADAWRENADLLTAYVKLHDVIGVVLTMPAE